MAHIFIIFHYLRASVYIVHICLSVKSQLLVCVLHSSDSTAESEPSIWIILILKQNLET